MKEKLVKVLAAMGKKFVSLEGDTVTYEKDGKTFTHKVQMNGDRVELVGGEREVKAIKVVDNSSVNEVEVKSTCQITGAADSGQPLTGYKWNVRFLAFGKDLNGFTWRKDVCERDLDVIKAAKIFQLKDSQHRDTGKYGKSTDELKGIVKSAYVTDQAVEGVIEFNQAEVKLRNALISAAEQGFDNYLGLSIDSQAQVNASREVTKILKADFDIVYEPAADGRIMSLAAAKNLDKVEKEGLDVDNVKDVKVDGNENVKATTDELAVLKASINEMKAATCQNLLTTELAVSGLPEVCKAKIVKQFPGEFKMADLKAAVTAEKTYLDELKAGKVIEGVGDIKVMVSGQDNAAEMLNDFFDRKEGCINSIKAIYQRLTGDEMITGRAVNVKAALDSTSWPQVLGDSVARKMLEEYKMVGLDDWRKIVNVESVPDFRTQRRMRFGGYGNLPAVAEKAPYLALSSPTDEEATYAVSKRGGTEQISREMIANDDMAALRRIPRELGQAAAWTLYEFVFDFLSDNGTIYDSVDLFHASHGNLGSAALDAASLAAGRLAMVKQARMDSAKRLRLIPKYVVVPVDLEMTAFNLISPARLGEHLPTSPDMIRSQQTWEVIAVHHYTDTNNWYLVADPMTTPTIEIGFLNGMQNPGLYVQDMPNVGSMFSNDVLTYKIDHVYSGAVMDYRGLYGAVVA